jgi:spore maturation protein CgeB
MWFVEDYRLFTYWRAFAPLYDFFFVIQREPFLDLLREAGVEHACYLPLAALPSFHRPLETSPDERRRYGADVAFLGAGYPNRRIAFRPLIKRNFKIWGSDWDGETLLAPCVQKNGERVTPEESVRIYNSSLINLNLHSSVRVDPPVPAGDFVNPRTFELAAMAAFQLVDQRSLLSELFRLNNGAADGFSADPAAELAVFHDTESMEQNLDYYLAHPQERREMAQRARQRVLAGHTYQHRLDAMLDFIRSRRPGWPAEREDEGFPADLPAHIRSDLSALLQRLELPPQTAFADLIARLRQESGVLGSLETSLLFLDEWRKQYGRGGKNA